MESLFFLNAYFEKELTHPSNFNMISTHPIYLQLQFLSYFVSPETVLPVIYGTPNSQFLNILKQYGIDPSCQDFETICSKRTLESWAPSQFLAHKFPDSYIIPRWDLIRMIHSKQFPYSLGFTLPHERWIETADDLINWWPKYQGKKVLKSEIGSSGRGHFFPTNLENALLFFHKQGKALASPWVDKLLDFSSQWHISNSGIISCLGSTICKNTPQGSYEGTLFGPQEHIFGKWLPYLEEHLEHAEKTLETIKTLGFFGNIGIDAMIYKDLGEVKLHPILEINARKTMGWATISLYKKLKIKNSCLSLKYSSKSHSESILPSSVTLPNHQTINLPRKLSIEIEENLICF